MTARRWVPSIATLLFASAFAVPTPAASQDAPRDLAELLPDLILREITLPRPATAGLSHVAHFSPIDADELDNPAVAIVRSFNTLMLMQLSTFPLGSPAGGFTYNVRRNARHVQAVDAELRAGVRGTGGDDGAGPIQRRLLVPHTTYPQLRGPGHQRRWDQVLPASRGMLFGRERRRHGWGRWRQWRWRGPCRHPERHEVRPAVRGRSHRGGALHADEHGYGGLLVELRPDRSLGRRCARPARNTRSSTPTSRPRSCGSRRRTTR